MSVDVPTKNAYKETKIAFSEDLVAKIGPSQPDDGMIYSTVIGNIRM